MTEDTNKYYILKLTSDEDVMGEIVGEDSFYVSVKNPIRIGVVPSKGQMSVGFQPFPSYCADVEKVFPIPKLSIVYSYQASDDFVENYKQVFSGVIMPPTKQIITG